MRSEPILVHCLLLSQQEISFVPWLRLRSVPVRADVLWVLVVVRSSAPAATAAVLDLNLGFSSEGVVAVSPVVAL